MVAMREAFFGFDLGTSSSKAILVDTSGNIIATASTQHSVSRGPGGLVEMDMNIWWQEFKTLYSALLTQHPVDIAGIGVSGMGPCLGVSTLAGEPLAPAALYGIDRRALQEIDQLTERYGQQHLLETYDSVLTSQAGGPKLAWFRKRYQQEFKKGVRFFMPHSWILWHLSGQYVLDKHSASQLTPLYNPESTNWDQQMLTDIGGSQLLAPTLGWSQQIFGQTRPCPDLPELKAGIPLIFGTIDAWAEQESVGAIAEGQLFLMYGTTLFLVANTSKRLRHPSMWGTTGTRQGSRNLAGGLATSGALTDWFRSISGVEDFEQLVKQAQEVAPGSQGLLALPYFAGERTPIQDPKARGILAGLTLDHGQGHIYRALLESTAFAVRHNIETMEEAGARIEGITCAGGGTKSKLWPQIISDVTGREQTVRRHSIGACLGDAFMVAQTLGRVKTLDDWNPVDHQVQPRQLPIYDQLYANFRELYEATAGIQHRLTDLANGAG